MLYPAQTQAIVILSDRVLHLVQGFRSIRLVGEQAVTGESSVAQLAAALPGLRCSGRATLVLGNPWAKTDLIGLPADARRTSADTQFLAEAHAKNFSSLSASPAIWRTRGYCLPNSLLVAALPDDAVDKMIKACAEHSVAVRSLQPLWTWLTQSRSPTIRNRTEWSAVIEPGFVTIAHQSRGHLDHLRTLRTDPQNPRLQELLDRQAAASGFTPSAATTIAFASAGTELAPPWRGSEIKLRTFA